ncbi:MAG: methyltransferase domain-containing protein [Parasphingorhabdus sp.]|uniref:class I SAM-dependent methyltransferase n=1 Tax=Parasphingorhabdus sp. TaxID=2709688 RepID=UPI003265358E
MGSDSQEAPANYQDYEVWKGWDKFFQTSAGQAAYYRRECDQLDLSGAQILEMGFGSGTFLNWARQQGASLSGTEVNPVLTKKAEENGVDVLPLDLASSVATCQAKFDAIFAFDVMEHLSMSQIDSTLDAFEALLKPGGRAILRFPNGRSPFGLPSQKGDPTHLVALSDKIFDAKLVGRDLKIVRYGGAARIAGQGIAKKIIYRIRYLVRDLISALLNFAYAMDMVWEPVVTIVLEKEPSYD